MKIKLYYTFSIVFLLYIAVSLIILKEAAG